MTGIRRFGRPLDAMVHWQCPVYGGRGDDDLRLRARGVSLRDANVTMHGDAGHDFLQTEFSRVRVGSLDPNGAHDIQGRINVVARGGGGQDRIRQTVKDSTIVGHWSQETRGGRDNDDIRAISQRLDLLGTWEWQVFGGAGDDLMRHMSIGVFVNGEWAEYWRGDAGYDLGILDHAYIETPNDLTNGRPVIQRALHLEFLPTPIPDTNLSIITMTIDGQGAMGIDFDDGGLCFLYELDKGLRVINADVVIPLNANSTQRVRPTVIGQLFNGRRSPILLLPDLTDCPDCGFGEER